MIVTAPIYRRMIQRQTTYTAKVLPIRAVLYILIALLLGACVQNKPYRTNFVENPCFDEAYKCDDSYIEKHLAFDLTFLEFTERGNLYSRKRARHVMDFIDAHAKHEDGAAVFVFVHGWKHNANTRDSNVRQFKEFLATSAENEIVGQRKVIGVFIGWRGDSVKVPFARETTYWARKSVAEEIGSGGATEVLSELKQILVTQFADQDSQRELPKNSYVIIGHSFGGAIVLSAVHDVLLHDIITAAAGSRGGQAQACRKVDRFADGIILLNPAIEANKIILLKEAAARCQFGPDQPTLMHVVSSDADNATKVFFPIGQYVNVTRTLSPKKLKRKVNGTNIELNEGTMNNVTAGNLEQLRTAYLSFDQENQSWRFNQCRDNLSECGINRPKKQKNHFPNNINDPLQFIKTDAYFIKNHNDVFGCYQQSFITTTILETQAISQGYLSNQNNLDGTGLGGCNPLTFDFKQCFDHQLDEYDCEPPR